MILRGHGRSVCSGSRDDSGECDEEMGRIIPWGELSALIELFYPQGEGRGRLPKGIVDKSMNKSDLA